MEILPSFKKFVHIFDPIWTPPAVDVDKSTTSTHEVNKFQDVPEESESAITPRHVLSPCPNPRITSLSSVAPVSANSRGTARRSSIPAGSYASIANASAYVPAKRVSLASAPMASSTTLHGNSQHSLAGIREEITSAKGEYIEDNVKDDKAGAWLKRLFKWHKIGHIEGKEKENVKNGRPASSESLGSIPENVIGGGKTSRNHRVNAAWKSFRDKVRVAGSAQTLVEPDPNESSSALVGLDNKPGYLVEPKCEEMQSSKRPSIVNTNRSPELKSAENVVGGSDEKACERSSHSKLLASSSQPAKKWFSALAAKNKKKLRKEILQVDLSPPEERNYSTYDIERSEASESGERKVKSEQYGSDEEASEKKSAKGSDRVESRMHPMKGNEMEDRMISIDDDEFDEVEVKSNTPSSIEVGSSDEESTGFYRTTAANLNDSGHRISDGTSECRSLPKSHTTSSSDISDGGEPNGFELNEEHVESEVKIREIRLQIAEQYSNGQRKLPLKFRHKYYLLDMLGDGAFGFVMVARRHDGKCNKESRKIQEYAVKFIARGKVSSYLWVDDDVNGRIPFEAHILGHLNHPNIVKLVDIFTEDKEYIIMVTEMHGTQWDGVNPLLNASDNPNLRRSSAPVRTLNAAASSSESIPGHHLMRRRTSCDLFECIDAHTHMAETVGRKIFAQIVEAIYYLNSVGLVHRDLKDENIVIDEHYNVKLIDFGSANWIPTDPANYFYTFNGTINYAAPEICRGNPYRGPEAEVWALGVLLYTIVAGQNPFAGPEEIIKGHRNEFPRATRLCGDLLRRTLHPDPVRRATIQEVRDHPWLAPEGYGDLLTSLRHPGNSSI